LLLRVPPTNVRGHRRPHQALTPTCKKTRIAGAAAGPEHAAIRPPVIDPGNGRGAK
jgi:hypothetical protein